VFDADEHEDPPAAVVGSSRKDLFEEVRVPTVPDHFLLFSEKSVLKIVFNFEQSIGLR